MEAAPFILQTLNQARTSLHRSIAGLSPDDLIREPHPPIGWLAWRMGRTLDSNISPLAGAEQLWTAEGWHARFSMTADPTDFGPGLTHTREQVRAFRAPSIELLLDYYEAACDRTKAYLTQLTPIDLDRVLDEPQYDPRPTVAVRLTSLLIAVMRFAGQIAYLRGLHRVGGWFPAEDRA